MSHETTNTETTHTVVLDYPGMVDPQVFTTQFNSFDVANHYALKVFNEETHGDTELDPSGKYHDPETETDVWVVTKKRNTTHPSEVFGR